MGTRYCLHLSLLLINHTGEENVTKNLIATLGCDKLLMFENKRQKSKDIILFVKRPLFSASTLPSRCKKRNANEAKKWEN